MILLPTSEISHHHKATNITMSPTSLLPCLTIHNGSKKLVQTYYKVKYKIDDKICYALVYGSDGRTVFKTGCCRFL